MGIEFLVVELLVIDDENRFPRFRRIKPIGICKFK